MVETVYKISERVGSGKDNDPIRFIYHIYRKEADKWILLFSIDEHKNTVSVYPTIKD